MKKNIIYALFTFCFVLFAGNISFANNELLFTSTDIIQKTKGTPNNDFCLPFPIDPEETYFSSYHFDVKTGVSNQNLYPGNGLPEAYFYIYNESFENMVSVIGPLRFRANGSLTTTLLTPINHPSLNDLSSVHYDCVEGVSFNELLSATLVLESGGEYIRYYDVHPECFPGNVLNVVTMDISFWETFCCDDNESNGQLADGSDPFTMNTIKTEETTKINEITISPNPFSSEILIKSNSRSLEEVDIELYDMNGRSVYNENIDTVLKGSQLELKLSHIPKGHYYIRLKLNGENILTKKIIKI